MLLRDNLSDTLKGYHFRNGKVTDKQVKEVRGIFKSIYHTRLRALKYNNASDEEIQEVKNNYKLLRGNTKTCLKEYAREKQEILKDDQAKEKALNKKAKEYM